MVARIRRSQSKRSLLNKIHLFDCDQPEVRKERDRTEATP